MLRGQALAALREKSANVDATGVFATLAPRHRRGAVIRAGVSLQIAVDYLDSLSESVDAGGALDDGLRLHRALVGAATGEPVDDPYGLHPRGEDGGYLGELVAECAGAGAVGRRRPSLRPTSCIRVAAPDRRQASPIDPRLPRQSQFEAAHLRRRGAVGGSQLAGELDGDRRLFVAWQRKRDRRRPRQRLRLHAGGGAPAFRRAPDWQHAVHDTIEAMFRWGAEEPEYARMGGSRCMRRANGRSTSARW